MTERKKPYLLMHDYGCEGWAITGRFSVAQDAINHALDNNYRGCPLMIVRVIAITAVDDDAQPTPDKDKT